VETRTRGGDTQPWWRHAPVQTLVEHQHTFYSHSKTSFKQKYTPKYANAYFLKKKKKKTVKIASAHLPPEAPPRCYSRLLCLSKFVSSAKYVLLPSKRNKITRVNVLLLLLPHFYTYTYISYQTL